jgi:flagellar operon protein
MAEIFVNGIKVPFLPVGGVEGLKKKPPGLLPGEETFQSVLQKELGELKFSKHAQERLDSRHIQLSETDLSHLQGAVARAEEKGAAESLVLLRDIAFIVSVKNKTVVTAMDSEHIRDNVFTNIDSAVIAA